MWIHVLLASIVLFFILLLLIKRFVYFRPSYEFMQPKDTFLDVYEGNLHAWFRQGTVPNSAILFCHGNAGNLSYRQDKVIELCKTGYSVLIFDYSGFGRSRGVPNEQLCYSNASMFVEYLKRNGFTTIIPYGESLGAPVAMYVARRYNLPKVILESGLPSVSTLIKHNYPKLSFLRFLFPEFDMELYIKGYYGKSLLLHSIDDEIIPYSSIKTMINLVSKFIEMKGLHNSPQIPWEEVRNFILKE